MRFGYKTRKCAICGCTWNVCKQKSNGEYICPHCEEKGKVNEEKKKA